MTDAMAPAPAIPGVGSRASAPTLPYASRIASLGTHLPERRVSTDAVLAACRRTIRLDLERITGIRERRVGSAQENSYVLALGAARRCLAASAHRAADLDMLISCSITRYREGLAFTCEPPVSAVVKHALGATRAVHFDVTNACAGMLTGVLILDDFIRRGAVRRGLVVSGECITNLSRNATREMRTVLSRQMASLTLGDAGSAVLLERADEADDRVDAVELATFGKYDRLCVGGPSRHGPGGVMHTQPRKLHRVAIEHAFPLLDRTLKRAGIGPDDVNLWVPHQTSTRAIRMGLRSFSSRWGVAREDREIAVTVDRYGNSASTAMFVALQDALESGRVPRGGKVLMMCFASGLVVGAAVLTLDELVVRHGRDH